MTSCENLQLDGQRLEVSVVQWFSISTCQAEDPGSISGRDVNFDVDISYQCREYYFIFTHSNCRSLGCLVGKTY